MVVVVDDESVVVVVVVCFVGTGGQVSVLLVVLNLPVSCRQYRDEHLLYGSSMYT